MFHIPSVRRRLGLLAPIVALAAAGAGLVATGSAGSPAGAAAAPALPSYDHIVLAIFENEAQSSIFGSTSAPYLTSLANQGAHFTQSYAIEHPSQPNYLDLFSGSNQGVQDDSCPHSFDTENLGHQLISSGKSFVGYAEDLPSAGSLACRSTDSKRLYQRKHAPWTNFSNLDQSAVSRPFTEFPSDFSKLPAFSWVTPNMCNDMHDCSISTGDTWAKDHLDAYAQWAKTHNSLLVVTFDEDDRDHGNQIETAFIGAHVKVGSYAEHIDHITVLNTLEALFGVPSLGATPRTAISDVWDVVPLQSGKTYVITRAGTNQVITDPGASKTSAIQMVASADRNLPEQHWTATVAADGSYQLVNTASGMCLDNAGASTKPGSRIIQYPCHSAGNQRWRVKTGTSGAGADLVNVTSGLPVGRASTADPAGLVQFSGTNPVWIFSPVG